MTRIVGYSRLESLYRAFLGLDLDKSKAEMIIDVSSKKLEDLFRVGMERAYVRGSDVVEYYDLPITKGLQETIKWYRREREKHNDPRLELGPIVDYLMDRVKGLVIGETVRDNLQDLTAAVLLLIGRVIKYVDPGTRKPSKEAIERAARILDLTL